MAIKIQDRVKQGTNTTGSGTITFHVSYASSGFDDFSVLGNGSKTYYAIEEAPSGWEVGIGTYNSNTLSRDTVFDSSAGGAKINLGGSGLVFVTLPASKIVIADENNNVSVTGLDVGATGIVFNDGTIQTTAFDGSVGGYDFTVSDGSNSEVISSGNTVVWTGAGNTTVSYDTGTNTFSVSGTDQDLSSYATQTYVNDASGHLQSQISTNDTDISNLSGLVSTNTTNISSNDTDIANLSGLVSTNSTDIATVSGLTVTNANNISSNDADISNLSGLVATNTSDISTVSGLTVTNSNNIDTVSGLLYNSWTASDGSNSEAISGGDEVKFTGTGATTVSYNNGSNTFTINTPTSEAGYEGWTATDGNATSEIANGNDVKITGAGNVTVSFVSGSPNVFTVSGADQDLSSYATQAYVTGASGHLQTQITTNVNNISSNDTDISNLSGLVSTNTSNIATVSGIAAGKDNYQYWTITDGPNSENIQSTNIVKFSGEGNTTVSYDAGSNTVSISGAAAGGGGGYDFTVSDGSNSEVISSGNSVTWTGLGNNTVTYNSDSNTFSISGTDQDLSSYATQSYVTGASGHLQSQINTNDTDISNLSGLVSSNTSNISTASGTLQSQITSNTTDISNTSGDLYGHWIISAGAVQENVAKTEKVKFTGTGATTVSYDTGTNTLTVNTPSSEAGYEYWTATDGSANTSSVENGQAVRITGAGNVTVDFASGSPNIFTVSGADQDLSSYATQAYVTGASGHLQTQISSNTARLADVSGSVDINTAMITGVSGNLNTVSGLLYTSWTVSDGSNSEAITAGGQVNFTGGGNTTVSYNTSSNTVTISGNDVTNTYNAGSGLNEDPLKTFNVQTDNSTLEVNSDIVRIKDGGVTNAKLANTGVTVTAGTGLTNGGVVALGASVTVDAITASTSAVGVVQLQDAVTDGTTDKAVTPNAVYDMSGVINGNINTYTAGSGLNLDGTEFDVKLDNSTVEFNSDIIQIKDDGVTNAKLANTGVTVTAGTGLTNGGVVALGASVTFDAILATTSGTGVVQLQDAITNGTIDRAVTPNAVYDMSGVINGNINTYTAGSGLNLDGTEFDVKLDNSTLEFNSDIIQIKDAGVSNAKLANDSVTITAGSGLSNGGEVDLGATKVIDITPGGVTNAMLAGSISESKLASDVNLDAVTDNGATTTNGINVGMIDTSGVRSSMQSGAGSSPGDTRNLDLSQASTFHHSMNSGLNNITLTNVTAGQKFVLRLTQNATATGTVSFFGGIRWPGGTVPTLTATTSKTDVFGFLCVVSGSYDGFIIGQNI